MVGDGRCGVCRVRGSHSVGSEGCVVGGVRSEVW